MCFTHAIMWSIKYLSRIDFRVVIIALLLNFAGLLTIASYSSDLLVAGGEESVLTKVVLTQLKWLGISWTLFFVVAGIDYGKLREWVWPFFAVSIMLLVGLFFADAVVRVHRWYKIPLLGIAVQPSEWAKIAMVLALSWFLEKKASQNTDVSTFLAAMMIVAIPFVLIVKQPDLGTALVLFPTACTLFYFGGVNARALFVLVGGGCVTLFLVGLIFSGAVPYEKVQPYARAVLREYQLERLNPNTHHAKAAQTAIALGGFSGVGFRQSEYWRGGSLPAPYTDSIFPSFGEEFGFIGLVVVLMLYYALFFCCLQTVAVAKDAFGRLLSAGIAVMLAFHVAINIGMMTGCLPITGVPLVLMSYGGSSMTASMAALGLIQSVYSRRFMF